MTFSYSEFTTRNIGFVTEVEQARLRAATVFICGTGGMGGAAVQSLIRAGVGHLILADIDAYEVSNLNRQVFCTLDSVDHHKAESAFKALALALRDATRIPQPGTMPSTIATLRHCAKFARTGSTLST